MRMVKFTMSIPEAMNEALEREKEQRKLDTIQETIRSILAEYFREQGSRGSRTPGDLR